MPSDPDGGEPPRDALAVEQHAPRYEVRLNVRLQRTDPELPLVEETTVTENLGPGGAKVLTTGAFLAGDRFALLEVGGPLRAQVEVIEATIGDDGVRRLDLRFLDARAASDVRERLRALGVLTRAGHVSIETEIPMDDVGAEAVRRAIEEAFEGAPGSWRVTLSIVTTFAPPWWVMSVQGHGELFRLSFQPPEQNPEFIFSQLRGTLRRRGLAE